MKKRIISLIFAFCMFIPCAFLFSACGEDDNTAPANTPKEFTISFVENGGSDIMDINADKDEEIFPLHKTTPTKSGYIFDGWYEKSDFSEGYFEFESLMNNEKVADNGNHYYMPNKNITLYAKFVPDGIRYSLNSKKTYYSASIMQNSGEVVVVEKFRDKPVKELLIYNAFNSLSFPNTIDSITTFYNLLSGSEFYDNNGLLKLVANDNVTEYLLDAKPDVVSGAITINANTKFIAESVFENCEQITSVTFQNSMTKLPGYIFRNCTGLQTVTFTTNSLIEIGDYAFDGCESLNNVVMPSSLNSIGYCAFNKCTSLGTITLPPSITKIDYGAFSETEILSNSSAYKQEKGYIIPSTDIRVSYFIKAPDTLTSQYVFDDNICVIAGGAFENREEITEVTISNKVVSIGYHAFKQCANLETIVVAGSIYFIGADAFAGTKYIADNRGSDGAVYLATGLNYYLIDVDNNVSGIFKLHTNTISICDQAFIDTNVTGFIFNSALKSIGFYPFTHTSPDTFKFNIYYIGNQESWNNVFKPSNIGDDAIYNLCFYDSILYFYSEEMPTDNGNFWHYHNNEPVAW